MSFEIVVNDAVVATADSAADALQAAGPYFANGGPKPTIREVKKQRNSQFGGALVTDDAAKQRIEAQQAGLNAAGVKVDAKSQLYATGTRMADVGYATQNARKAEFDAKMPIRDVAAKLTDLVKSEARRDVEYVAGDLASTVAVTAGRVTLAGYRITPHALRGMLPKLKSGALGYLLSLRDRSGAMDAAMVAGVLAHELSAASETKLKLRVRENIGDCFAVVSPTYAVADAPIALQQIASALPKDARGAFSYDPTTTAWELRADVWTPTPVAEQAVGEAFSGYAALGGRDGGNGSVYGRGGVLLLRCLNASTYAADGATNRRVHRGQVTLDIPGLFKRASESIDALCKVWGVAREVVLTEQPTIEGIKLSREIAMLGYFRGMLSDKRSELQGVLPGRTDHHAAEMVKVYATERRDSKRLVKSDLAQSFTRYLQSFDVATQRDGEHGVSQWLASSRALVCDADMSDAEA